jgi:hypothetical protein
VGSFVPEAILADVSESEWPTIQRAALLHRVTPALFLGVRGSDTVPPAVMHVLESGHETALRRHLACWELLREVAERLDGAGIEYVALKGPVLSETVYPRPDLRSYGDLDVLVRGAHFDAAVRALEATGAALYESNWDLMRRTMRGELNLTTRFGVSVDLHWSLFHESESRSAFAWPSGDVVTRAERTTIADRVISVPDPTDQLLHLCAHACLEGGWRLSWLQDIRLAATLRPVDWVALRTRANDAGLGLVVAVMLDRVNRCFASELPIVYASPRSRSWLGLVRVLDRVRPPWSWYGSRLSGRLLVSSTRTRSRDSARALVASLRTEVAALVREPEHPWRRGHSRATFGRQIPEMLQPGGGASGRDAFMAAVGRAELT